MTLKEELNAETEKEIRAIHADTSARIARIIAESERKADGLFETGKLSADHEHDRALSAVSSEAEADCRAKTGAAFSSLVGELRKKIMNELEMRWNEDFASESSAAIAHGASVMNVRELYLEFPPCYAERFAAHEEKIRRNLSQRGVFPVKVSFSLKARGGLTVKSVDGRRVATLTFEESVRRLDDEILTEAAKVFGYAG